MWQSRGQRLIVGHEPTENVNEARCTSVNTSINKQQLCVNVIWLNRLRVAGFKIKKQTYLWLKTGTAVE